MTDSVSERYIGMVTLVVLDYNEAMDWYVDVSGFQLIEDTTISTRKRWITRIWVRRMAGKRHD
jgi:catechol 2,3-dioxygenase-like lactoylglutathione lyase family enzyme